MKKISLSTLMILALGLTSLAACGGGSSSSAPAQPTTAVLTLSTTVKDGSSIPDGTTINSYKVTITLPDGVTVKSTANPPETDAGVVTVAGAASGALISGVYTEATSASPGTVEIFVADGNGFDPGTFCTVKCNLAAGRYPMVSDFAPLTLDDATGIDASSSTVVLTGQLSMAATSTLY